MAVQNEFFGISLPAGEDLSSHQFRFITVDADGKAIHADGSHVKIGILQNKPGAEDRAATVAVAGMSKLEASGGVNEGAYLTSDGDGKGAATTTDDAAVGAIALTAGVDGDIISVLLTPGQRY